MTVHAPPSTASDFAQDIAAALDWWKGAGVDLDMQDKAQSWLDADIKPVEADATSTPTPAPKPVRKAPPPRPIGADIEGLAKVPGDEADWPATLEAFQTWWLEDEKFAPAGAFPKISPRGAANADVMIIVGQPEEQDTDRLLSGQQGQVLSGFLRAAGIAADTLLYVASALPRHTLRPDWGEVDSVGYGQLLAHHIRLAAPKRLIVFGRDILALFPHESAQDSAFLQFINHDSRNIPLLPARDLANLARRGGFRAKFWQQWLDFTDG